ncbi:MAG: hypothetical protein ACOVRN_00025 [Flavobacterium sp.]
MNQVTTQVPVNVLYRYIKQQGIVYDDICHELADHVICALEQDNTVISENFQERLNAYIHSHNMVAMITAAKEQVRLRERAYRKEMAKGLVSPKGLLQLAIFSGLFYAAYQNEVTKYMAEAVFVIGMLFGMWAMGFKRGTKALPGYYRLLRLTGFYLLIPLSWFNKHITPDTLIFNISNAVSMALIVNILLLMWQVNQQHNRKYYV